MHSLQAEQHTSPGTRVGRARYAFGFVMEQTLGQVTHDQNFRRWVAEHEEVAPTWMAIPFEASDGWDRAPVVRHNWTLRASLRARAQVRHAVRTHRLDGLFFHTQVTALLTHRVMHSVPPVVSLDATPLNLDSVGRTYGHVPSRVQSIEALKNVLTRRTFRSARRLIAWSSWAKQSLVSDYGIEEDRVAVIPPGIDLAGWRVPRRLSPAGPRLRLLMVGGDFERKGGEVLLDAYRRGLLHGCQLDIVTRDRVKTHGLDGIHVYHGLTSNCPGLRALFAGADLFVFPTLGDCLPIAIIEAMASGLPVISTRVGAIAEQVHDGVTGLLVAPGDVHALAAAVRQLASNRDLRLAMGAAARRSAERLFDGSRNYQRVLDVCKQCVDGAEAREPQPS
jgi:glycosyltransferase involved in cell wall biosynthesis